MRRATAKGGCSSKCTFDARDSGLLAALPDELWKTLCCLATYMDEDGNCYPSQARLASDLGIRREHMNKRIKRLLAFRFHGEPIITMAKTRESRRGGSRWANNVYRLRAITGLAMFEEKDAPNLESHMERTRPLCYPNVTYSSPSSVCAEGHTEMPKSRPVCDPLCDSLCDPEGHTNQIEPDRTITLNVNGFKKSLSEGEPKTTAYQPKRKFESAASFSRCLTYAVTSIREGSIGWSLKRFPKN